MQPSPSYSGVGLHRDQARRRERADRRPADAARRRLPRPGAAARRAGVGVAARRRRGDAVSLGPRTPFARRRRAEARVSAKFRKILPIFPNVILGMAAYQTAGGLAVGAISVDPNALHAQRRGKSKCGSRSKASANPRGRSSSSAAPRRPPARRSWKSGRPWAPPPRAAPPRCSAAASTSPRPFTAPTPRANSSTASMNPPTAPAKPAARSSSACSPNRRPRR